MHSMKPKSTGKRKAPARSHNKCDASDQDMESLHRSVRANFGSPSGGRAVVALCMSGAKTVKCAFFAENTTILNVKQR